MSRRTFCPLLFQPFIQSSLYHGRIDDIIRLAKEYKVDGVIDVNLKFCSLYDVEGYTVERELQKAGIPVLGIETDYVDSDAQQLRTRISAFIEMLGA